MRYFFDLPGYSRIDFWMIVPVQVRPNGRICVEIFAALHILEHRPFALQNHDWVLFEPVAHLREWMPYELVVEFGESMHDYFTLSCKAFASVLRLSDVCVAVTVIRNLAWPRATVG